MRHVIRILVTITALTLLPGPLWADLGSFAREVEKEESKRQDSGDDKEEDKKEESENSDNFFFMLFWDITFHLWGIHNSMVRYQPYPYANSETGEPHFITYYHPDYSPPHTTARNFHWFELLGGGTTGEQLHPGLHASLQGKFLPFIGPDIEYRSFYDDSDSLEITTIGLTLPIIQHDALSLSMYGQGALLRGVLDRNGGTAGVSFRSYLFKPVSIYLRAGGMFFDNIDFFQLSGRLNLHVHRFVLYAGGNLLQAEYARLQNLEAGVGLRF